MAPKVKVRVALNREITGKVDTIIEASEYLEVSWFEVYGGNSGNILQTSLNYV